LQHQQQPKNKLKLVFETSKTTTKTLRTILVISQTSKQTQLKLQWYKLIKRKVKKTIRIIQVTS
jgi:hypothetical protein